MTKTIVVLGATGLQVSELQKAWGGSVASKFLQDPNWTVRGVTRSTSSDAAKALVARGIEVVAADLDSPSSFDNVFKGAHAIFAMTDFWAPFYDAYPRLKSVSDRATGEHASAIEIRRAKTAVDAAAKALKDEGLLEMFIYSSLPSIKQLSRGKYTYAYHFDAKAEVNEYIASAHPELNQRTSILNMGFYYTNLATIPLMRPKKEADGSFTLSKTGFNDAVHPFVYPPDTGEFVALLINSAPGKNLLAVSELASYTDIMKIWSEVTGKKTRIVNVLVEEMDKAMPGGLGREAAESTASSAEFGWGQHLLLPKDIDPNVRLTSVREYIEKENWEEVLRGN
ncbi:MAG: hypothetical protein M1818_000732 [Claussenomyces sp. TS43310]|nr:MAG: hypothetical protein M1818_000732 [Claussenomyces sp. TS43310]